MKKFYIFLVLLLLIGTDLYSENCGEFSFTILPTGFIPLGESSNYFDYGGGGGFSFELAPPFGDLLAIKLAADCRYIPLVTRDAISVFSVGGGVAFNILIFERLKVSPYGMGGYYYGFITDGTGRGGGNFFLSGGLSISYYFSKFFSLGFDSYYLYNHALYTGIGGALDISYHMPFHSLSEKPVKQEKEGLSPKPRLLKGESELSQGRGVEIVSVNLKPVFPVLFKHYNSSPLGKVVVRNTGKTVARDVVVSFFVDKYMDNPKECGKIANLKTGEKAEMKLYALFSDSVLKITEGTKVSAKVMLSYMVGGSRYNSEKTVVLDIYDRNATTWDDNRKAAAFVTAKDPSVLEFSKKIVGWIRKIRSKAVDANLSVAMGLHEALRLYGIGYVVDPKTPYSEYSKNRVAVDFLQFPRQTLKYSAGDCDDLSILYCALLESVGIETAFITIPGHVYMAFCLNVNPEEARRNFLKPDELIFANGKVWIPVEVTMIDDDFLKAWGEGAKEWRENKARKQTNFYPTHECWKEYAPVGLPGVEASVKLPARLVVVNAFQQEMIKFIDREIYPRVSKLQRLIRKSNNNPKYVNKLGVLYARYGLMEKAILQFNRVLEKNEYLPALINMGNIRYLKGDMEGALAYYRRAKAKEPSNPKVLLCMARVNHELENYGIVKVEYEKLKKIDPLLAERFSYLALKGDEASRAAKISAVKEVVVWDED